MYIIIKGVGLMSIKEKLLKVIENCEEKDLYKIWVGIPTELKANFKAYVFDEEKNIILEEEPDEFDFLMIEDIENNPDCNEFISQEDALKELGIDIKDL